ncbi:MAG: CPBP family intramembrane metalloprotease [Anaerolineales bacterium]|nr:CPBP family intramembrane metalloprotease [Anaerolineales bacterium]
MFKKVISRIRQPEAIPQLWGWPLPFWLLVGYVVANLVGLLMVTTQRDDELTNPDATSLVIAGLISCVMLGWSIYQNVRLAVAEHNEQHKKELLNIPAALALRPSQSRPLWLIALWSLAAVVTLDALAVILGRSISDYPLGFDRISGASWLTWVLAGVWVIGLRPIGEELLFRGILYPVLARRLGDQWIAVLVTTILFVVFYLALAFDVYWGLVYPLVLGLAAGMARAHTQSTWGAVVAHMMFGAFLLLSALVNLV